MDLFRFLRNSHIGNCFIALKLNLKFSKSKPKQSVFLSTTVCLLCNDWTDNLRHTTVNFQYGYLQEPEQIHWTYVADLKIDLITSGRIDSTYNSSFLLPQMNSVLSWIAIPGLTSYFPNQIYISSKKPLIMNKLRRSARRALIHNQNY